LKRFFNETYTKRYNKPISESLLTLIWSLANGALPLGGAFGGLLSGVAVEKLGQ